jgi:hypothetical protein
MNAKKDDDDLYDWRRLYPAINESIHLIYPYSILMANLPDMEVSISI